MPTESPQASAMEARYQGRLNRYVTAMRGGKPDMVPIRPFVAEFTGVYAGYTCQELAHDYQRAFAAARKCAADFDWDAVVSNMVYVWTAMTDAMGLSYYGIPGIHISANTGFQYREPPQQNAFMRPDEYDQLIEDPNGFLLNVWLPRVSAHLRPAGEPVTEAHNLSLLKGGMAMMEYFGAFAEQNARLRAESGTVSAISGILKAPMDIIADKLRGYLGLVEDLFERRDKVLAACEALMPHLLNVARSGADPQRFVPIGYWMHRGGVPFVSPEIFRNIYWPTIKPIVEELWADGHQTLFYAEGNWDYHLESFAELPDAEHDLSRGPGRHLQGASGARRKVLLERRRAQRDAGLQLAGRGPPALQEDHRGRGPRRPLHHGRQRDRSERGPGGEPPRDDRRHARVRRLFVGPFAAGGRSRGGGAPAGHQGAAGAGPRPEGGRGRRSLGRETQAVAGHLAATKTWSGRPGSTSTAWRTCIFGRSCSRFDKMVPSPAGRGLG